METHKIWRKVEYWTALKNTAPNWSYAKYLKGLDLKFDENRNIVQQDEDRRIHKILWMRTLKCCFLGNCFLFHSCLPNFTFIGNTSNEIQ